MSTFNVNMDELKNRFGIPTYPSPNVASVQRAETEEPEPESVHDKAIAAKRIPRFFVGRMSVKRWNPPPGYLY